MADFNDLSLTFRGAKALLEAQAGKTLALSKIGLGSGTITGDFLEILNMAEPQIMIPISNKIVDNEANYITLIAKMTNEDINDGFYWRETGLFFRDESGEDILFAYTCVKENEKYDYVPAYSDKRYVKHVRIANVVADKAEINIVKNEGLLYVDLLTYEEFLEEYEKHIEQFEKHIEDLENPHKVTAEQVGLGNVPNVSTNNQTPTYTTASTLTRLISGEKLSVAFGKISKAINSLISHLADTKNPHKVTARQIDALTVDEINRIKPAVITANGLKMNHTLDSSVPVKINLDSKVVSIPGCRPNGKKYSFEMTDDGGIKCPSTGEVLVSGSVYITADESNEIVNKGCIIRYKTVKDDGEYSAETDVCSQFIRDVGVGGGITAGTTTVHVQDGDIFYLYARSSSAAKCDATDAATYLSLAYLGVG